MNIGPDRSTSIGVIIGLATVALSIGLALALWGAHIHVALTAGGALLIASGLFLLAAPSRHLLKRDPDRSPAFAIPAGELAVRRLRTMGASVILMGCAQLVPDSRAGAALMLGGAVVGWAAVLRLPRRFFDAQDRSSQTSSR